MNLDRMVRPCITIATVAALLIACDDDTTQTVDDTAADTIVGDTHADVSDDVGPDTTPPAVTEITTIAGPDDAVAADVLPVIWFPGLDDDDFLISEDMAIGLREALVLIEDNATVGEINAALSVTQGRITGALPGGRVLLMRFDTDEVGALGAKVQALAELAGIEIALPELGLSEELLPTHAVDPARWVWDVAPIPAGPFVHGNWGLEAIRAPQLWNLDTFVRRQSAPVAVAAGVVDAGFTDTLTAPGPSTHPDFQRANSTWILQFAAGAAHDHGSMVAGIIGAAWDDGAGVTGVDPWLSAIHGRGAVFRYWSHTTWGRQLNDIVRLIRTQPDVRVVNNSYGLSKVYRLADKADNKEADASFQPSLFPFGQVDRDNDTWIVHTIDNNPNKKLWEFGVEGKPDQLYDLDNDGRPDTWAEVVQRAGDAYAAALKPERKTFMIVASAGNAGPSYKARENSPINSAAHRHGGRFISVESTRWDNTISPFSDVGGTVSAPGECVRSTEAPGNGKIADSPSSACSWTDTTDGLLATSRGTSFAAPHVSGMITALWKLAPSLTIAQMRTLITGAATTVPTGGTRRADAFAAAMAIDALNGDDAILRALVDVDDGTIDGNQRATVDAAGLPVEVTTMLTDRKLRGDGEISMADFRAYRDAQAQAMVEAGSPAEVWLDGSVTHFKRDLNFDGCVGTQLVNPPHPAGTVQIPLGCADAPAENVFPRYDFNGDGQAGLGATPFRGANLRDIDVLMRVWPDGDLDRTEGYTRDALPGLLPTAAGGGGSADLIITPGEPLDASDSPYDEIRVTIDGVTRSITAIDNELVWTVPRDKGVSAIQAVGFKAGAEVGALCASDGIGVALAIAEDRPVELVRCDKSGLRVDEHWVNSFQHFGPPAYVGTQAGAPVIDIDVGTVGFIELSCPAIPVDGVCFIERPLPYQYATGKLVARVTRSAQDVYSATLTADFDPIIPPLPDPGGPGCGGLFGAPVNNQRVLCEAFAVSHVAAHLTVQTEISSADPMQVKCGITTQTTVTGLTSGNTFAPPTVEVGGKIGRESGPLAEVADCFHQSYDTHEAELNGDKTTTIAAESGTTPEPRRFELRLRPQATSARYFGNSDFDGQTVVRLLATASAEISRP